MKTFLLWAIFCLPLVASQANETEDFGILDFSERTFDGWENQTSTNKTTAGSVINTFLDFFLKPFSGSNTRNETLQNRTGNDDFDDFFDSFDNDEKHAVDHQLSDFISTVELANDLANELKNELTDNSDDKEAEMLAAELQNATETLSMMMESKHLTILLETASKIIASAKTCQDLANLGLTQSGTYQVDPDGPDSVAEPIMVTCDFTTNTTEIIHDKNTEIKIEKCIDGENGCHQTFLNYDAPMDQIRALVAASETCEQSIRFDCFLAPLMTFGFGLNGSDHMGFWRDWNGTQRTFFHGNLNGTQPHMCQCGKYKSNQYFFPILHFVSVFNSGVNQTCVEPSLLCNCDAKLPDWQFDEGIITDKDLLPLTEFAYGPLEYDLEEAKVSIGSLKCSGSASLTSGLPGRNALPPPKILRNDCGLAALVTDNRLKINLRYNSDMRCYITLELPETKTLKLTIDDFEVSLSY